jgi:pimeloyl-ACP methyl ester carboxylesterase
MRRVLILIMALALAGGGGLGAQRVASRLPRDDGWTDKAPHKAGFITVQRGIRIHYLDFGGTGAPVLFIPGIGNTAHAYDDFAPAFTDRFHVYAMTRRGFGESSHPAKGYSLDRLTDDIRAVMDSLGLRRVDLVGHSFAGQEMTHFLRRFPDRVRRVVYLDGAYDNILVDSVSQEVFTTSMPYPAKPEPTAADTSTYAAYVRFVHATRGVNIPESDIRVRVKNDGIVEEAGVGYTAIGRETEIEHQDWPTLRHPALAIFALRERFDQSEPWITADTSRREEVQAVIDKSKIVSLFAVNDFRKAPRGETITISGGHHWIFVSHRERVLAAVREFLLRP